MERSLSEDSSDSESDIPKISDSSSDQEDGTTSTSDTQHSIKRPASSQSSSDSENNDSFRYKRPKLDEQSTMDYLQQKGQYSSVASKMMAKMGYQAGKGLGTKEQGRVDIIETSNQKGKRGLGLRVKTMDIDIVVHWEDEKKPSAVEHFEWIPRPSQEIPQPEELADWMEEDKKKLTIDDEDIFCERKLLQTVLKCKTVFDELEGKEMRKARFRSNPYETIAGAFFLNRAAMKMANIDFVFDRMFTNPKDLGPLDTLYFADICAGPGGFSEYVLWKKKWEAKGFGFTLKGNNDFKLEKFVAGSSEFFEPHYGVGGTRGDGDIMNSDNLEAFREFVLKNTNGKGVSFVMADGGFDVEGNENIQEILNKQLLLCQFACALSILRMGGCFVCKTFDLFTPFSAALIYLLRLAFDDVCLFKPVTSRPANSERYVVCRGYHDEERLLADYMISANQDLNDMKNTDRDISMLVPLDIMLQDKDFVNYVKKSNEEIAEAQCKALAKIHDFCKDITKIEPTQNNIRDDCLKLWEIPDKMRTVPPRENAHNSFKNITGLQSPANLLCQPILLQKSNLNLLERMFDFRFYISGSNENLIILSLGGALVLKWVPNNNTGSWVAIRDVNLLLPRGTLLNVEIVQEMTGEGKGQRHKTAVHVIDAYMLAGVDVSKKHFTERINDIKKFVHAIQKPSRTDITQVREKEWFRTEELQAAFDRLEMKIIKGRGRMNSLCYRITDNNSFYIPNGLCFVKITKEPWTMAFSKTQKRKYFFNTKTGDSVMSCPKDFSVPFSYCAKHQFIWPWEDGVKVHPSQEHRIANAMSRDEMLKFVHDKMAVL